MDSGSEGSAVAAGAVFDFAFDLGAAFFFAAFFFALVAAFFLVVGDLAFAARFFFAGAFLAGAGSAAGESGDSAAAFVPVVSSGICLGLNYRRCEI